MRRIGEPAQMAAAAGEVLIPRRVGTTGSRSPEPPALAAGPPAPITVPRSAHRANDSSVAQLAGSGPYPEQLQRTSATSARPARDHAPSVSGRLWARCGSGTTPGAPLGLGGDLDRAALPARPAAACRVQSPGGCAPGRAAAWRAAAAGAGWAPSRHAGCQPRCVTARRLKGVVRGWEDNGDTRYTTGEGREDTTLLTGHRQWHAFPLPNRYRHVQPPVLS